MFYVLGKYLYLFLDITSKLSVFPDFPRITKFVNPARFSLFFINCLAGILPLNGIIFSLMLLFFSGGSSLQCLLTASMTGFSFHNWSLFSGPGLHWLTTWRFERNLKIRFWLILSGINFTQLLLPQYMLIHGNFKFPIIIDTPKTSLISFLVVLSSLPEAIRANLLVS